jgi:hypothetical protein
LRIGRIVNNKKYSKFDFLPPQSFPDFPPLPSYFSRPITRFWVIFKLENQLLYGAHLSVSLSPSVPFPLAVMGSILMSPSYAGYKTALADSAGLKSCACPNVMVAQVSTPSPPPLT